MNKLENKYEVSVIIPTYNRSGLLRLTLDSLVAQNLDKAKFEAIVCDDGSSDDTANIVDEYMHKMNIKYFFQEDLGYRPGSARNGGIRAAEGRICLFVDSSVILDSDCIAEHMRFHDNNSKNPVAVIGYVYGFDHNEASEDLLKKLVEPADPASSIKRLAEHAVFHDVRESHYVKYRDRIDTLPAPWYYFWTCHLSVARKDLIRVGLFDQNYDGRWGVEDNDLGFRLHNDGVQICLLRTARSIHYPHGKNKAERLEEGYQNCLFFHNKFKTLETGLFLNIYKEMSTELIDINEMSISITAKQSVELQPTQY